MLYTKLKPSFIYLLTTLTAAPALLLCCGTLYGALRRGQAGAAGIVRPCPRPMGAAHAPRVLSATRLGVTVPLNINCGAVGVAGCQASLIFFQGWMMWARLPCALVSRPGSSHALGLPGGFGGAAHPPRGPGRGPCLPALPPSTAFQGRPWASGEELCSWFKQAEVALLQATCRLQHPREKGGWNPSPAFGLVQRRYYDNGEIVIGPGLCLHTRAAAGSDYAATMFCSINIMSSLNLY